MAVGLIRITWIRIRNTSKWISTSQVSVEHPGAADGPRCCLGRQAAHGGAAARVLWRGEPVDLCLGLANLHDGSIWCYKLVLYIVFS